MLVFACRDSVGSLETLRLEYFVPVYTNFYDSGFYQPLGLNQAESRSPDYTSLRRSDRLFLNHMRVMALRNYLGHQYSQSNRLNIDQRRFLHPDRLVEIYLH